MNSQTPQIPQSTAPTYPKPVQMQLDKYQKLKAKHQTIMAKEHGKLQPLTAKIEKLRQELSEKQAALAKLEAAQRMEFTPILSGLTIACSRAGINVATVMMSTTTVRLSDPS